MFLLQTADSANAVTEFSPDFEEIVADLHSIIDIMVNVS